VEQDLFHVLEGAAGHALLDKRFNFGLVDFDAHAGLPFWFEYGEARMGCQMPAALPHFTRVLSLR
jgi:hypothetical protein